MTEKTNIDDIIGIVKTEEKTDSVELKKEYYKSRMTENKRYYLGNGKLLTVCDSNKGGSDGFNGLTQYEVVDLLNEQEETIQTQKDYIIRMGHGTIFEEMKRLKERNQRQYERLKEITDLMMERDWKSLEKIVKDWEQAEEQLEREWGTYGDVE